jgi:hypothetical protein
MEEELSFWMILVLASNKSVLNKDLHFFDLKAAVIEEQSNFGALQLNWNL